METLELKFTCLHKVSLMSTRKQARRKRSGEKSQSNSRVLKILHDIIGVGLFVYSLLIILEAA